MEVLEKGEPLVAVYPLEHGKFLCQKAKSISTHNSVGKDNGNLLQAKEIAIKINAKEGSILPKTIKETEEYLFLRCSP